mmetsp:Transcript_48874/g.109900  ORF Transcript_48874/g.109900 Transcript_48874/m.109900 type:complete len:252 (+) Transcript_48874:85-840(+)
MLRLLGRPLARTGTAGATAVFRAAVGREAVAAAPAALQAPPAAACSPFQDAPGGARAFSTVKRVTQRRRSRARIVQLKQTHYEPKPDGYAPLPLSLMASGPIRRVIRAGTVEAKQLAGAVDWERYKCDVPGVRWHPVGGWRVQFDRRDYEHNFFVKCSCYFRVSIYGFDRAKELAIGYRKRLEAEWEEQQRIWAQLDAEREAKRLQKRVEREQAMIAQDFEDGRDSIWGHAGASTEGGLAPPSPADNTHQG